ncbi:flagellar export chaperone FliS [Ectothiorhodospiraceae bacterium WFHF3C12]|nr:flagellar export chaperone FliS [Ectothiorhodospiraceae bacterium WFHF3C12]
MTYNRAGIAQYQQTHTYSGAAYADPHRLVQMLMEGALERIAQAKGALERGETAAKGERIGKAIGIVEGLRAALDAERGGEIAGNLDGLYEYMARRLLEANLHNDPQRLDEVAGLMREIKEAWDAIPPEYRNANNASTQGVGVTG